MPKPEQTRITRLQTQDIQPTSVDTQVVARPVDTVADPAPDWQLAGLLDGLAKFNPKLEAYGIQKQGIEQRAAEQQGKIDGRIITNPVEAVTNPITYPEKIAPAYQSHYAAGFNESLGMSLGGQSRDAFVDGYTKQKNNPDFNVETYIKGFTAQEFAGITNPSVLEHMSQIHAKTVLDIRADYTATKRAEFTDGVRRNLGTSMGTLIAPNMTASEMYQEFTTAWLPSAVSAPGGYTRPEAAKQLLGRIHSMSSQAGGDPNMFDVFDIKDAAGQTIGGTTGELRASIDKARIEAKHQRDSRMHDEVLVTNANASAKLDDAIRSGDFSSITDEKLQMHINKFGVFPSEGAYTSFRDKRDKAIAARGVNTVAINDAANGNLWAHPEKDRKAAVTQLTQAPVDSLVASINATGAEASAARGAAVDQIIQITSRTGTVTPNERLAELFGSIGKQIPAKDAVAPERFNMAVDVYSALKAKAPNLLNSYFDEDTQTVMDSFTAARNAHVEPKLAYQQAYSAVSPEAKALVKEREKDPTYNANVRSAIEHAVPSGWNDFLHLDGIGKMLGTYPTNEDTVVSAAKLEIERRMKRNPNLGVSDAIKQGEAWAKDNFIHDKNSNLLVRVPAGQATDATAEAITAYSKETAKALGKDATVEMVFNGKDGYSVISRNPDQRISGDVSLESIMQKNYYVKHFTAAEGAQMGEFKKQLSSGLLTGTDINNSAEIIAKAKQIGAWTATDEMQMQRARRAIKSSGSSVAALFGPDTVRPAFDNLDASALPANASKTDIAKRFLDNGDASGALTTMGEGVALRAYKDPSRGTNIGIGYNMTANAANITEDFRRAGIPADLVEGIKNGTVSIDADQAMRLFTAVQPRYTAIAKAGIEAKHAGVWDKLPPNQKAVLVDMAYQVGSIEKFTKMADHLSAGDLVKAGEGMKVNYRDRTTGETVVDVGRHNLRMNMLHTPENFTNILAHVARKPRTVFDARKLASNQ